MNICSPDGGEKDEHIGAGFVEMYKIFAVQYAIFFGTETLDRVCKKVGFMWC